jgi:hypothetical protein
MNYAYGCCDHTLKKIVMLQCGRKYDVCADRTGPYANCPQTWYRGEWYRGQWVYDSSNKTFRPQWLVPSCCGYCSDTGLTPDVVTIAFPALDVCPYYNGDAEHQALAEWQATFLGTTYQLPYYDAFAGGCLWRMEIWDGDNYVVVTAGLSVLGSPPSQTLLMHVGLGVYGDGYEANKSLGIMPMTIPCQTGASHTLVRSLDCPAYPFNRMFGRGDATWTFPAV